MHTRLRKCARETVERCMCRRVDNAMARHAHPKLVDRAYLTGDGLRSRTGTRCRAGFQQRYRGDAACDQLDACLRAPPLDQPSECDSIRGPVSCDHGDRGLLGNRCHRGASRLVLARRQVEERLATSGVSISSKWLRKLSRRVRKCNLRTDLYARL